MPTLAQLYGAPQRAATPLDNFAQDTLQPLAEKLVPKELPEVNPGIISLTGRALGGGLGAVGNLLDLPGSSVRDVLALRNPLDQWMDPLGYNAEENRVTGRDLLRQYGAVGEKDTWGNFAAGFAVDVATDPLSFTGIGNLNKAGTAAKKAGMLDYAREVGNQTALDIAKKNAPEGMTAKLTRPMRNVGSQSRVTPKEIFDHLQKTEPDKYAEVYDNWRAAGGTEDLLNTPLRDVLSFRIPGLMKDAKTWRVKDTVADRADWSEKNSRFVGNPESPDAPDAPVVNDVPDVDGGGSGTKATTDPNAGGGTTETTQPSGFQVIRTTKGGVNYKATREAFRSLSENHSAFDDQLEAYQKGGAISKDDSLFLQSIYSDSDMEFANRMIGSVAKKKDANGVIQQLADGYKVTLVPKGSSVKSPVSVLNHEMGHMAFWELEKADPELFAAAQREISEAIADGSLLKKFKVTDGDVKGNMLVGGGPMRAEVQLAEYYQHKPHEVFAQLFSHAMDAKVPGDAIVGGGAVTELLQKAWEKIKEYVAKVMQSATPNDPRLSAIEKLMDYTGGFKTADDRARILDSLNNLKAQDGHSVKFFTEAGALETGRTLASRAAARVGLIPPADEALLNDSFANVIKVEKETDGMFRVKIDEQKLKEAWPVDPNFKQPVVDPVDSKSVVDVAKPAFTFENGRPAATLNSKLQQPNTLKPDDVEAAFEGIPTAQHGVLASTIRQLRPDLDQYIPKGAAPTQPASWMSLPDAMKSFGKLSKDLSGHIEAELSDDILDGNITDLPAEIERVLRDTVDPDGPGPLYHDQFKGVKKGDPEYPQLQQWQKTLREAKKLVKQMDESQVNESISPTLNNAKKAEPLDTNVIKMRPQDFLDAAAPFGHNGGRLAKQETIDALAKMDEWESTPYLTIKEGNGGELQVGLHDGRHRALAAINRGDEFMDVEIRRGQKLKRENPDLTDEQLASAVKNGVLSELGDKVVGGRGDILESISPKVSVSDDIDGMDGAYSPLEDRIYLNRNLLSKGDRSQIAKVVRHELAHQADLSFDATDPKSPYNQAATYLWDLSENEPTHPIFQYSRQMASGGEFGNDTIQEVIANLYAGGYPHGKFKVASDVGPDVAVNIPKPLMDALDVIEEKVGIWSKKKERGNVPETRISTTEFVDLDTGYSLSKSGDQWVAETDSGLSRFGTKDEAVSFLENEGAFNLYPKIDDAAETLESISPQPDRDKGGFYYNVDRMLQTKVGGRIGFEQFKATAKKFGVKDEEIDDLDLASLFSDGKPKTKDEIQNWVDDNKVELKTIETKDYAGYQIPGGDEGTYREMLVTRTGVGGSANRKYNELSQQLVEKYGDGIYNKATPEEIRQLDSLKRKAEVPRYTGPHFSNSDVITHLRMDDVTLPNGKKALRVQELQSDWHQTGKKEGYRDLTSTKDAQKRLGEIYSKPGDEITPAERIEADGLWVIVEGAEIGVTNGPFKKNWTNLALKHVLKEAAEKGYDEVMIVKGEDAARAVGGPEDALGTFYDSILHNDMKKLTKKWGSFQGIGNLPKAQGIKTLEWSNDLGEGLNAHGYAIRPESNGGFVVKNSEGEILEYAKSIDEAKTVAQEISDRFDREPYSGDVQVFKVTPEMRDDLLEAGQAMYSISPKQALESFGKTWLSKVPKDSASAVADFIDRGGDLFYATAAGRALAGLFNADLFGAANSEIGRELGRSRAKAMDEATVQFREAIDPAMTLLAESSQLDVDKLMRGGKSQEDAIAHVNKISNSIVHYFEGVSMLDDSINTVEIKGALEAVRKIKDEVWKKVEDAGLNAPTLQDFFVEHFPRRKVDPGKSSMRINPRSGPVVEVSVDSQKKRDDLFRDIPAGTAVLNELSVDPVISGALHRPAFMKRKLSLDEIAKETIPDGDVTMREYVFNFYGPQLLTTEKLAAYDPKKSTDLDAFIEYFAKLDPKYADTGTNLFGHNPIGDLANYMSDGNRVALMADSTQQLIGRGARMKKHATGDDKLHQIEKIIGADGMQFGNVGKVLLNITKHMEPEMQSAFKVALDKDASDLAAQITSKKDGVIRKIDDKDYLIKRKDVDANGNVLTVEVFHPKKERSMVNGEVVTKDVVKSEVIDLATNPNYLRELSQQDSARKFLENFGVEDDIYKDATRFMKPWSAPEEYGVFERGLRRYINVMKAGLTAPWPAFHVRNFVSGSISNAMLGLTDPRYKNDLSGRALWQPIKDAYDLRSNKPIDLRGIAGYGEKTSDGKYILSEEEAMKKFQSEIFSMGIIGEKMGLAAEFIGDDLSSLSSQKPGMNAEVNPLLGKFSPTPPGRTWLDYLNPLATRDGMTIGKIAEGGATSIQNVNRDMFVGATAGKDVASFVEDLNRISGYIASRRQGAVPRVARAAVNKAQVDYTKLSSFESKKMRLLIPFYSFSRGTLPTTTMELIQNPGGPMATTIKLANRSRNPEEVVPDHIASTVGIPVGETSDGSKRYLTGFGLGFEDSLNLLNGPLRLNPMETLRELGGRSNPVLKGAFEMMTGRSLFQDGPVGGKELTELDPPIGRTLSNISDLATGERTKKAEPFISPMFEHLVANSPASRFTSTARTITDPRKWENPITGLGMNLLTGARVNDVSPQAQDAIYSERLARELKEMGGRTFQRPYISDEREAQMTPEERAKGEMILGEIDKVGKRFKARRENKEAEEKLKEVIEKGN